MDVASVGGAAGANTTVKSLRVLLASSLRCRGREAWLAACVIPFALAAVARSRDPLFLNHDVALYLECGRQLLEGKLPYVDFIDLNPPLVMYLHAAPAAVAKWLSMPAPAAFDLWLLGFAAVQLAVFVGALRELGRAGQCGRPERTAFLCVAGWFALGGVFFGQREHVLPLAIAPYLAMRWGRWAAGTARPAGGGELWAGFAAALAAFLKPHFLAIVAAPEVAWGVRALARRAGGWRAVAPLAAGESLAFWGTGVAYLAHFALLPGAVREAFFGRIVPLVVSGYSVYAEPVWPAAAWLGAAAAGLFAAAAWLGARRHGWSDTIEPLALMSLMASVAYFAQGKGWAHHALPAAAAGVLLVSAVAGRLTLLAARRFPRAARVAGRCGPAALAFTLVAVQVARVPPPQRNPYLDLVLRLSAREEPVAFLSTDVFPGFPTLVQAGRPAGCRYLFCFPVPMLYRSDGASSPRPAASGPYRLRAEEQSPQERRFLVETREDLAVRRPRLVFVAGTRSQACPPGFSMHEYLERTGVLSALRPGYERLGALPPYVVYRRLGD
ncbi:MAG: hypothetical protein HYY25_06570 [Candidatus Wallbacteria bacterium]|nr:hypothetical protein [Candidatus Wallbacteria bacterium]